MAYPADYHLHTYLCGHATGAPVEYARAALQAGLSEIGFADHAPMRTDGFDDWRMRQDELAEYVEMIRRLRTEFPRLTIRLGLEVDYIPGYEDWVCELANMHQWDYFIGSVHYVGDWDIDNAKKVQLWHEREVDLVWAEYFELLARAAHSRLFDIIGHVDLPKKFGFRPRGDCTRLYEMFIREAAAAGVAIEVNTAGLRKPCAEIYPASELLRIARSYNVPITFGSDAHAPDEVGAGFASAIAHARAGGYTTWMQFVQRERIEERLD